MTKLSLSVLVLSLLALGGVASAEPDPCSYCTPQSERGTHFSLTINDCAYLHGINHQNLTSWAQGNCGGPLCESFYRPVSCTPQGSGGTTVVGDLEYRCDCYSLSSALEGAALAPGCGSGTAGGSRDTAPWSFKEVPQLGHSDSYEMSPTASAHRMAAQ